MQTKNFLVKPKSDKDEVCQSDEDAMRLKTTVRKRKIESDNEEEQRSICIEHVSQGEEHVEEGKNESETSEEEGDDE